MLRKEMPGYKHWEEEQARMVQHADEKRQAALLAEILQAGHDNAAQSTAAAAAKAATEAVAALQRSAPIPSPPPHPDPAAIAAAAASSLLPC